MARIESSDRIIFIYIAVVLLSTWIFTLIIFSNLKVGFTFFGVVMFFPAIIALIFNLLERKSLRYMFSCLTRKPNLKSMIFGIGYPLLFISVCAIIALITGLGYINLGNLGNSSYAKVLITVIILILVNLIPAFGEEYGWRGYLLPRLTKSQGKLKATIIVGIVWALFHFPLVYSLAAITGIGNPLLIASIQAAAVFMASFSFSYAFYLSKNLIPVLFYHSTWNVFNVLVLGDIYTKKAGIIVGNIAVISGEGVLGLILGLIIAIWFVTQFRKSGKYSLTLQKKSE